MLKYSGEDVCDIKNKDKQMVDDSAKHWLIRRTMQKRKDERGQKELFSPCTYPHTVTTQDSLLCFSNTASRITMLGHNALYKNML